MWPVHVGHFEVVLYETLVEVVTRVDDYCPSYFSAVCFGETVCLILVIMQLHADAPNGFVVGALISEER